MRKNDVIDTFAGTGGAFVSQNNTQQRIEKVLLRPEEEVTAFFKKLKTTTDTLALILQLSTGKEIELSFPIESTEAKIIRKKFRSINVDQKIAVLRLTDVKTPILIRKIRHGKNKKETIYIDVKLYAKLEKYQEPGKSIVTAIEKLVDIVENRETVVAVYNQGDIVCNKMQQLQEPNRVYCKRLETIVSKEYCTTKCVVAPHLKELSERAESSKPEKTATLERFLQPPKNEHLRVPLKTEQDHERSYEKFGVFLRFSNFVQKRLAPLRFNLSLSFI